MHTGPDLKLSAILRRFYIICGKQVVKSIANKCTNCLRYTYRCVSQQMASLPINRLTFTCTFVATDIDYAGLIKVTPSTRRGFQATKGSICIFVCLVTRAVHMEMSDDLVHVNHKRTFVFLRFARFVVRGVFFNIFL